MIALYLWATASLGAAAGLGAGYVVGLRRGQQTMYRAGIRAADPWAEYVRDNLSAYAATLPHDNEFHVCTDACKPQ